MRAWLAPRLPARGRPAAFLDRDGTINRNRHGEYITRPSQLRLYSRAAAALKLLAQKGYTLVVLTNQSGIARGYMTERTSAAINRRLLRLLAAGGVEVAAVYYCPHGPADGCRCRKPETGLLREARRDLKPDMKRSFLAGDKGSDIELARRGGLEGLLVLTGGGRAAAEKYGPGARDLYSLALAAPDTRKKK
jgi:D-glycero-D-manno-heptose 1,7-bisphosphate phosphatase